MENWTPEQLMRLTLAEASRFRIYVGLTFFACCLGAIALGLMLPKSYASAATVLAERQEILTPLMEGSAVDSADRMTDDERIRYLRELLFSRNIISLVVAEMGLVAPDEADEQIKEQAIRGLIDSTDLAAPGPNLVRIEVKDADPDRAFAGAKLFSELLVSESESEKARESREAFEFIDSQAREYHQKLLGAEQRLTEHRARNVDIAQGTETALSQRISRLQSEIERTSLELEESRTRVESLQAQLSGESQVVARETRVSQYRAQIASLQEEMAVLRLQYTDSYPDIVNLKFQIADIEKALNRELRASEDDSPVSSESSPSMTNPLYQSLRQSLANSRTEVAALQARLAENKRLLAIELDRAKRIPEAEAILSELTRDYEVNNTVYQDLLRRRENARVSMNMDLEESGGNFRVIYPANFPVVPDGLRVLHFAIIGPLIGLLLPFGFIATSLQFDPRIRHEGQISKEFGFDVLGEVGLQLTAQERARNRLVNVGLAMGVCLIIGVYGYLGYAGAASITLGS